MGNQIYFKIAGYVDLDMLNMFAGTTTEANEPFEVDDDVSHEASENKGQG